MSDAAPEPCAPSAHSDAQGEGGHEDSPENPTTLRLPLTEAQYREIARRSRAYRADPAAAVPLEGALERIERGLR